MNAVDKALETLREETEKQRMTVAPATPARPRVERGAIATIKYSDRPQPERIRIGGEGETKLDGPVKVLAWNTARLKPLVEAGAEIGEDVEIELPDGTRILATVYSILPRQGGTH